MTRGCEIARSGELAATAFQRFRGLMFRNPHAFREGCALVIDPCGSIHMFFMRFAIDVLYMSRDDEVVAVQESLRPWRIGRIYTRGARYVIELPAGTIKRTGTREGDHIQLANVEQRDV